MFYLILSTRKKRTHNELWPCWVLTLTVIKCESNIEAWDVQKPLTKQLKHNKIEIELIIYIFPASSVASLYEKWNIRKWCDIAGRI